MHDDKLTPKEAVRLSTAPAEFIKENSPGNHSKINLLARIINWYSSDETSTLEPTKKRRKIQSDSKRNHNKKANPDDDAVSRYKITKEIRAELKKINVKLSRLVHNANNRSARNESNDAGEENEDGNSIPTELDENGQVCELQYINNIAPVRDRLFDNSCYILKVEWDGIKFYSKHLVSATAMSKQKDRVYKVARRITENDVQTQEFPNCECSTDNAGGFPISQQYVLIRDTIHSQYRCFIILFETVINTVQFFH